MSSTVRLSGATFGYFGSATSQTDYLSLGNGGMVNTNVIARTETNTQVTWHTGGTLTNLCATVFGGTNNIAATLKSRIAGGLGNLSITGINAQGIWEDTTHSDTVSAGNTVSLQYFNGSQTIISANGWDLFAGGASWTATGDTVNVLITGGPQTLSTASQTSYVQPGGAFPSSTTQANGEWLVKLPTGVDHITFRNLYVRVSANTSTNAISISLNGASGSGPAPAVSITGGSGAVNAEDTIHTIQAKDGDKISYKIITGASTVNCTIETISIEAQSDNNLFHWVAANTAGVDQNGVPAFPTGPLVGPVATITGNGTIRLPTANTTTKISLLSAYVMTPVASSSLTLQQSGSNVGSPGNVSVPTTATGWVTDSTNTYTVAATNAFKLAWSAHDFYLCCTALTFVTTLPSSSNLTMLGVG